LHNRFAIAPRAACRILSQKEGKPGFPFSEIGAGNEARTRDLNLGKVALYQLSYSRVSLPQLDLCSAKTSAYML
jgi:hypothetical protein